MASESPWPAEACPVCLQSLDDARVLPCLHVVCRVCVDQLVVTASGGDVICPVCRSSACLPPSGAACLPKDAACALGSCIDKKSLECRLCDADKTDKKPALTWCKQCRQAFCEGHAGSHILSASSSGEQHHVIALKVASTSEQGAGRTSVAMEIPVCSVHRQPLRFHCGDCNALICGDCSIVGDHQNHGIIRYVRDVLAAKKMAVGQKVDTIKNDIISKLEHAIHSVDGVTAELIRRSDEVLGEVRQTGSQVVQMVEVHIQQMEQEVTDLRDYRCKVLDRQRDELKSHLDAAKNAVRFKEGIADLRVGEEAEFSLLLALEARAASLATLRIKEEPESHARLTFQAITSDDLACKTKESIGKVISYACRASAQHSEIEGGVTRTVRPGSGVIITVQAKDCHGDQLHTGGDAVTTRCAASPSAGVTLSATVTDNNDGSYIIACTSESPFGEFQLEVFVNGEKMTTDVKIAFAGFAFDSNERHPYITLSDNNRQASLSSGCQGYFSVLGASPMQRGQHSWKMKVGLNTASMTYGVGLGYKPISLHQNTHSTSAYCWHLNCTAFYRDGVQCPQEVVNSSDNDTLNFDLNCDQHMLKITNVQSGQVRTFTNLPAKEYFPYACMNSIGQSVEFVE